MTFSFVLALISLTSSKRFNFLFIKVIKHKIMLTTSKDIILITLKSSKRKDGTRLIDTNTAFLAHPTSQSIFYNLQTDYQFFLFLQRLVRQSHLQILPQ